MSKVAVDCPNCAATLTVPADVLGRKVKCPKCQEIVRLPAKPTASSAPAPAQVSGQPTVPAAPSASSASPELSRDPRPKTTTPRPPSTAKTPAAAAVAPAPVAPAPVAQAPVSAAAPAERVGATAPVVPMAKVLTAPVAGAAPLPTVAPVAPAAPHSATEPLNLDALAPAVVDKPRVKLRRRRSNPWPVVLLGVGALAVLGLVITFLVLYLPRGGAVAGPAVPEIQYVNDARTDVGQTVKIPIAISYPSQFSAEEKLRWQIQLGPENPAGAAWDATTGHLTWSPGTRDAGKSHTLSMTIQNTVTRELNQTRFQVHVPALAPSLMAALAFWEQAGMAFTASLPRAVPAMAQAGMDASLVELQIAEHLVQVYGYPDAQTAQAKWAELTPDAYESLGLSTAFAGPISVAEREGAILVAETAALEALPSLRTWFENSPAVVE